MRSQFHRIYPINCPAACLVPVQMKSMGITTQNWYVLVLSLFYIRDGSASSDIHTGQEAKLKRE